MKKAILALVVLSCTVASHAQDTDPAFTNKRGVQLLPQSGDWGLGVNAVPFLNYLGNSFNASSSNSVSFGFLNADRKSVV